MSWFVSLHVFCAVPPPWLTAERAAGVDAGRPHAGLIRVTDTVVEGDEDGAG